MSDFSIVENSSDFQPKSFLFTFQKDKKKDYFLSNAPVSVILHRGIFFPQIFSHFYLFNTDCFQGFPQEWRQEKFYTKRTIFSSCLSEKKTTVLKAEKYRARLAVVCFSNLSTKPKTNTSKTIYFYLFFCAKKRRHSFCSLWKSASLQIRAFLRTIHPI